MFIITAITEKDFDKIILEDKISGTALSITPACGAIIQAFSVPHNGGILNVIENYQDKDDFKKNVEAKGFRGTKLSPFVCRLKKGEYIFAAEEYKIKKFYLDKNAIHGLLYNAVFVISHQSATHESATVTMKHEYRGEDTGYPFHYDCIISYQLKKGNEVVVTTEIINRDKGTIPMADGWHPYFTFSNNINDLQLEFQSLEMLEFDGELIPTGKLIPYQEFTVLKKINNVFFDNCFTLNFATCQPMLVLRDSKNKIQLEVYPDTTYPYLQLYTPQHRKSIAIENLSAAPDAFNNGIGLKTLTAGEHSFFKTTYKISSLA
ncbi:MAG: aldose 1-epimerase [Ferruginibacter sp.]